LEALQAQLAEQRHEGAEGDTFTFGAAAPFGGLSVGGPGGLGASSPILDYGLPLLGLLGQWLLAAIVLLVIAWLLGGRPRPAAMLRMSAWALLVPSVARSLVAITVMLSTGRVPVPGLSAPLPTDGAPVVSTIEGDELPPASEGDGPVFMVGPGGATAPNVGTLYLSALRSSFLSSIDLYTLWALVLVAVGVAVTARLGWLKSTLTTAGYWGFSLALAALPAVLSFWLMSFSGAGRVVTGP
jgi:hypothetical protein